MSKNEPTDALLKEITLDQIKQLVECFAGRDHEFEFETIKLVAHDILFEQGNSADCMFWLQSGKLEVKVRQADGTHQVLNVLTDGSHVGEMGLLSSLQRSATVGALEDSTLVRVTMDDIIKLSSLDTDLLAQLNNVAASRWQDLFLGECLKELFDDLAFDDLQALQKQLEWLDLSNGDVLFHEGDEPDGVYIVVSGRLRAKALSHTGDDNVIGELEPADLVGEYALLTDEPRSATVYAIRNTSVAKMSLALLDKYISASPALMRKITRTVIQRHKQMLNKMPDARNSHLTVTVLKHDSVNDSNEFTEQLAALVKKFGDTLVIDSEGFDAYFGQQGVSQCAMDTPIQPVITSRLNELESRYRYIFFVADGADSNWTKRAIGQSDRILLVAKSESDPDVSAVEKLSEQQTIPLRTDLVLLHPADTQEPTGTAAWLAPRNITTHYHVRDGDRVHLARMARRLTGHAIGLVCSGGGARGYAQMGVYKAMLDSDIPIDYIGGTSMGAITSSVIACGYAYDKCVELSSWTAKVGVADYTLPLASFASSKNVTRICKHNYGERLIEDLWIPYFCISSNLTKAERVVHQQGMLWRAVRASMAIPGVFLPIVEDGDVLVDGGVMDNYPVRLMSDIAETTRLIGVNVNPYRERSVSFDYDTSLSGWRILMNRLNPFSKRLRAPSVMGTILRSLDVNSMKNTKKIEQYLELNIVPDLRKFSMNDYGKWKAIAQSGFDEAHDALADWKSNQADLE